MHIACFAAADRFISATARAFAAADRFISATVRAFSIADRSLNIVKFKYEF